MRVLLAFTALSIACAPVCRSQASRGTGRATGEATAARESASALRSSRIRKALLELIATRTPDTHLGPVRAELDVYELELRERLRGVPRGPRIPQVLRRYFFEEKLYHADPDLASPDNFYLDRVIAGRQGYCLSLSAMILAVCRRLRLPVWGVAAPRHFFLRYDDGTVSRNIETTEGGRVRPDAFYRERGVTARAERDGVYLVPLSDDAVVAHLLNNEGFLFWCRGDLDAADARFARALKLHPRLVEALMNRGVVAASRGADEVARGFFERALAWLPGDTVLRRNSALNALRAGRLIDALSEVEVALRGAPKDHELRSLRDLIAGRVMHRRHLEPYQGEFNARGARLRAEGRLHAGLMGRYHRDPALRELALERVDRSIQFEWRWSAPAPGIPADSFSVSWDGWLEARRATTHRLMTVVDGGVRVWLDELCLIDAWEPAEGRLETATVPLTRGLHALRVAYRGKPRASGIIFKVKEADASRALPADRFWHEAPGR